MCGRSRARRTPTCLPGAGSMVATAAVSQHSTAHGQGMDTDMASFSRTQECNPQESIDVTRLSVTRVQVHSHYSLCNPRRFDMHIHNASGAHHPSRFVVIAHHEPHAQTEETGCSCPFRVVVLRRLSATPAAREGERRFQRTLRLRSAVAIFIRYPHPLGLCLIASFRQRLLRLRLCY